MKANLFDQDENWKYYKCDATTSSPLHQIELGIGFDERQTKIKELIEGPSTILDLGCADGSLLILLYSVGLVKKGIGIDLCEANIEWGQKHCANNNLPITFSVGPVELYSGERVDYVILGEILEHLVNPARALRVAKQYGDNVIITVPIARPPLSEQELKYLETNSNEHIREYTKEKLEEDCRQAGLQIVRSCVVGTGWVNLVVLAK